MEVTAPFTVNGSYRREKRDGRDYIVAPVSMIVPGVLNGSNGPLLYRDSDLSQNVERWNDIPLVINHPRDGDKHVSARHPRILEKYGVGRVYEPSFLGSLNAEAWFDEERTKRKAPKIYGKLVAGEPIEVSTGLDAVYVPMKGAFNGVDYTHLATNFMPDHLAVLTDSRGACGTVDGCGINVNDGNWLRRTISRLAGYLTNAPSDSIDPEKACQILKDGAVNGKDLTDDQRKMFGAACSGTQNAFCPTGPGGGVDPTCGGSGGGGGDHSAAAEEASTKAEQASKDAKISDTESNHYKAAEAHRQASSLHKTAASIEFQKQGSSTPKVNYHLNKADEHGIKGVHHLRSGKLKTSAGWDELHGPRNIEGDDMATREQNVQYLTANCDCYKGKEKVLANGDLFTDAEVERLVANDKQFKMTVNAVAKGVTVGDKKVDLAFKDGALTANLTADEKKACLDAGMTQNWGSLDEWLRDPKAAPPFVKDVVRNASKANDAEKRRLARLIANASKATDKDEVFNRYVQRPLEDLQQLADDLSLNAVPAQAPPSVPYWVGGGAQPQGGSVFNDTENKELVDAMVSPDIDFTKKA